MKVRALENVSHVSDRNSTQGSDGRSVLPRWPECDAELIVPVPDAAMRNDYVLSALCICFRPRGCGKTDRSE
jgi:hypothetical protein